MSDVVPLAMILGDSEEREAFVHAQLCAPRGSLAEELIKSLACLLRQRTILAASARDLYVHRTRWSTDWQRVGAILRRDPRRRRPPLVRACPGVRGRTRAEADPYGPGSRDPAVKNHPPLPPGGSSVRIASWPKKKMEGRVVRPC